MLVSTSVAAWLDTASSGVVRSQSLLWISQLGALSTPRWGWLGGVVPSQGLACNTSSKRVWLYATKLFVVYLAQNLKKLEKILRSLYVGKNFQNFTTYGT